MSHLTGEQKTALRHSLMQQLAGLTAELEAELRRLGLTAQADRAREVGDSGDDAVADFLATLDAGQAQRHTRALEAAQSALVRLDDAAYGACIECAQPIPFPRLAADPAVTRCVTCQTRVERSQTPPATL